MSYDLMVFEKTKAPTNPTEFFSWYQKQTEWNDNCDYNDYSHASEKLQKFFHKIKDIFPPMNGPFSPTNKELSENPDLEERLCDYCIGKDLIYLSLAYSVSGRAYELVKRAAYFSGVGFFAPEEENVPIFFDNRYPMLLEGEWFSPLKVSNFENVREKLNEMTAKNRSFLYITDQVGNYMQVGGYCEASAKNSSALSVKKLFGTAKKQSESHHEYSFTVEKRIYTDIMAYTHKKAEYASNTAIEKSEETGSVSIAGNPVQVKQHQILSSDIVERLFYDFFQETQITHDINWTEWCI